MSYLEIAGLTKRYDTKTILNQLDLSIDEGEFVSLLGPSGCGKTTTLQLIAGFVEPDAGSIHVNGQVIDGVPSYRRDIGFVFQHYALFPHMTVAGNIAFGLEQRKFTKASIKGRVNEVLEVVQLDGMGSRKPAQLSGGQQQRVALARALVIKPRVLLLDESLGALDKKLRVEMQIELRQIQQAVGITTVFVTHDQEEALTMSDRIAVMREGRIVQFDTPSALYHAPVNGFVARAVGDVNILSGAVVPLGGDDYELCGEDGEAIRFRSTTTLVRGEQFALGLRPHQIDISVSPPKGPRLSGIVTYASFAGNSSLIGVSSFGQELKIEVQSRSDALLSFQRGDKVWLSWARESVSMIGGA